MIKKAAFKATHEMAEEVPLRVSWFYQYLSLLKNGSVIHG